jgi:hypothetical protein
VAWLFKSMNFKKTMEKLIKYLLFPLTLFLGALIGHLANFQAALSLFGMEQSFLSLLKGSGQFFSQSNFLVGLTCIIVLILSLYLWWSSHRRYQSELLRHSSLLENLINVVGSRTPNDEKRNSELLIPFINLLRDLLPKSNGNNGNYRIALAVPLPTGRFKILASAGIPLDRIDKLQKVANWKTDKTYFSYGLQLYQSTRPVNGRIAKILKKGEVSSYQVIATNIEHHDGVSHLIITLNFRKNTTNVDSFILPLQLAVLTISCSHDEILDSINDADILVFLQNELNCICAALILLEQ